MPVFTVIIPTRDREAYLREAVDSVLAQTCADLELLVVNDGASSIESFDDQRVQVIENGQKGAVPARNLGASQATGAFIAFLDDDDIWIGRDHLSRAADVLARATPFYFADGIMRFPGEARARAFDRDADARSLEKDNTILVSAVCYARALHSTLGLFDAALPYYWDWDWYLRVARAGHVLHRHAAPMVDIRIHPQNMSGESNAAARRENLNLFARKHGLGQLVLKSHADFSRP